MNSKATVPTNLIDIGNVIILISLLFIPIGCERQEPWESFDCKNCYQDKPEMGPLQIKVTINGQNPIVPFVIYRGVVEDNNIEFIDSANRSDWSVDVPVNNYYSVNAQYKDGNNTIFVIDGDKLKLKENNSNCDERCYYFQGGYIDVRLRNY
jgi:hypothetical protein